MRNKILLLVACLLSSLFCSLSVKADDECLYLDYCGSQISSTGSYKIGSNASINAGIYLTAKMLSPYIGSSISGIMVGTPNVTTKLPSTYTAWLRVDTKESDKVTTSAEVTVNAGWQRIDFNQPYIITGEETGIYVGYSYYQSSGYYKCLSFVSSSATDASWIGLEKNGKTTWSDASANGALSIRAVLTGDIPSHDLCLQDVKTFSPIVKLGDKIRVSGSVLNNAYTTASKPKIRYSLGGKVLGEYTIPGTSSLAYLEEKSFTFTIPTNSITHECSTKLDLELLWSDGSVDDRSEDNKVSFDIELLKETYLRKMVCEEGTGTWCMWCVRGIVCMKEMEAQHPDDFICIGIHGGDEYAYTDYYKWKTQQSSSYPIVFVNRDGNAYAVNQEIVAGLYQDMVHVAVAEVGVTAKLEGDVMTMTARSTYAMNQDHEARIAFVVLEDSVMASQVNAYAGGAYGEMGGFEKLGSPCTVALMDVARYISNVTGDEESAIEAPRKGNTYDYTATVDLTTIGSQQEMDKRHLSVVALLIDQQTGEILNAGKTEHLDGTDGVEDIVADKADARAIYNLAGQRLAKAQKGINIIGGRKVLVR